MFHISEFRRHHALAGLGFALALLCVDPPHSAVVAQAATDIMVTPAGHDDPRSPDAIHSVGHGRDSQGFRCAAAGSSAAAERDCGVGPEGPDGGSSGARGRPSRPHRPSHDRWSWPLTEA